MCVKLCKHVSELAIYLDINILLDRSDTHSQTVCNKCYFRLKTIKKRSAIPPTTTLEHAKYLTESAAHLWKEFDATMSEEECSVCSQFLGQTKGGRPVRQNKRATEKE